MCFCVDEVPSARRSPQAKHTSDDSRLRRKVNGKQWWKPIPVCYVFSSSRVFLLLVFEHSPYDVLPNAFYPLQIVWMVYINVELLRHCCPHRLRLKNGWTTRPSVWMSSPLICRRICNRKRRKFAGRTLKRVFSIGTNEPVGLKANREVDLLFAPFSWLRRGPNRTRLAANEWRLRSDSKIEPLQIHLNLLASLCLYRSFSPFICTIKPTWWTAKHFTYRYNTRVLSLMREIILSWLVE